MNHRVFARSMFASFLPLCGALTAPQYAPGRLAPTTRIAAAHFSSSRRKKPQPDVGQHGVALHHG